MRFRPEDHSKRRVERLEQELWNEILLSGPLYLDTASALIENSVINSILYTLTQSEANEVADLFREYGWEVKRAEGSSGTSLRPGRLVIRGPGASIPEVASPASGPRTMVSALRRAVDQTRISSSTGQSITEEIAQGRSQEIRQQMDASSWALFQEEQARNLSIQQIRLRQEELAFLSGSALDAFGKGFGLNRHTDHPVGYGEVPEGDLAFQERLHNHLELLVGNNLRAQPK